MINRAMQAGLPDGSSLANSSKDTDLNMKNKMAEQGSASKTQALPWLIVVGFLAHEALNRE